MILVMNEMVTKVLDMVKQINVHMMVVQMGGIMMEMLKVMCVILMMIMMTVD